MVPESRRQAGQWLVKARGDLDSAKILLEAASPQLETGLFHCQQAAEKVLKGWLTFHQIPFLKTHDLAVLLNLCVKKEKEFLPWQESLPRLTPFATESRYPGDAMEPAAEDVREAERTAREVVEFVFEKIGKQVRG